MEYANSPKKHEAIRDPLIGFDIGWDYARHGLGSYDFCDADGTFKCVLEGHAMGLKQFPRTAVKFSQDDFRFVSKWLHIRLNAFRRGRIVSPSLTWMHIKAIDAPVCSITREKFTYGERLDTDWTIDRVNNDAAYAPSNIVCMSKRANKAKDRMDAAGCLLASNAARARPDGHHHGLNETEWMRLAYISAINASKPSVDLGCLPMAIFPPNNFNFANSFHMLQNLACPLFMHNPDSTDVKNWIRAFKILRCHRIQKRVIAFARAARLSIQGTLPLQNNPKLAMCDAWLTPIMSSLWLNLVEKLTLEQSIQVVSEYRAISKYGNRLGLVPNAAEEWGLETNGYVCASMLASHSHSHVHTAQMA